MRKRAIGLAVALLVLAGPAFAQEVELGGELRPRFEIRDPVPGVGTVEFTSMRTRASLGVALEPSITVFMQLQDVRTFGEEGSTLTDYSANGLDLHQGWAELGDAAADRWSFRVGRQEAAYGGERLIGAVNWTQQGRAFDGARIRFRPSEHVVVDGLAFRITDQDAIEPAIDRSFYGIYSTLEASGDLDLFLLLNTQNAVVDTNIYTAGARWVSGSDELSWRLEGAFQTGEDQVGTVTRDRSAFMLGARVGRPFTENFSATLWYDYLSGDDDPADNTYRAFDTLFATNHKFYGYMDLFLNIPAQTNGRGLQDLAVKTSYQLEAGRLGADLHVFALAADGGLDSGHIGEELDFTYRWPYATGVAFTGGLSYFLAGDAWSVALGNADENQVWGYLMLDVLF